MRFLIRFTALVALLLLVSAPGFAQGTSATLTGTVTSAGTALPGATITVSSPALLGTRTTVSGSNGDYSIPALPPGDYSVVIETIDVAAPTDDVLSRCSDVADRIVAMAAAAETAFSQVA